MTLPENVGGLFESDVVDALSTLDTIVAKGGRWKAFMSGSGVRVINVVGSSYEELATTDGATFDESVTAAVRKLADPSVEIPEYFIGSNVPGSQLDGEIMDHRLDVYPYENGEAITARFYSSGQARFGHGRNAAEAIGRALTAPVEPYTQHS